MEAGLQPERESAKHLAFDLKRLRFLFAGTPCTPNINHNINDNNNDNNPALLFTSWIMIYLHTKKKYNTKRLGYWPFVQNEWKIYIMCNGSWTNFFILR